MDADRMPAPVVMTAPVLVGADARPVTAVPRPMPVGTPPGPEYLWRWLPGVGWGWIHKDIRTPVQTAAAPVVAAGRWVRQCVGGVCQLVFVRD